MEVYIAYINNLCSDEDVSPLHIDPNNPADYPGWPEILGVYKTQEEAQKALHSHKNTNIDSWLKDFPDDYTRESAEAVIDEQYAYHWTVKELV